MSIVHETLKEQYSIKSITTYLNDLAAIILAVKGEISWVTPAGISVNSTYNKFKTIKTKSFAFSTSKPVTLNIPTNESDEKKSKPAFLANLVHSLDGTNIHLLVDLMENKPNDLFNLKTPLYTIPDCFASSPRHIKQVEKIIKEAFIMIYFGTQGYIEKIHNHIVDDLRFKSESIIKCDSIGKPVYQKQPSCTMRHHW